MNPTRAGTPRHQPLHARAARAFTLLEITLVLAVLALLAGIVGAGITVIARSNDERAALTAVLDSLTLARLEALRTATPRRVTIENIAQSERLRIATTPGSAREIRSAGIVAAGTRDTPDTLQQRFDAMGRAAVGEWTLAQPASNDRSASAPVRIWHIRFDPVSGAPSLLDEAARANLKENGR